MTLKGWGHNSEQGVARPLPLPLPKTELVGPRLPVHCTPANLALNTSWFPRWFCHAFPCDVNHTHFKLDKLLTLCSQKSEPPCTFCNTKWTPVPIETHETTFILNASVSQKSVSQKSTIVFADIITLPNAKSFQMQLMSVETVQLFT